MTASDVASKVTALVKTFERPRSLDRLLRSLRRFYPNLRVIVGDDSVTAFPRTDVDYVRLPVDIGVAAGRNAVLELVETPYFLSLDDDFSFTAVTRIEELVDTLQRHDAALVAGDLIRCEQKFPLWIRRNREVYHGLIRREGDSLRLIPGHSTSVGEAFACDLAPHFFLARTDVIRSLGGWFAPLKMDEHQELLFRLKEEELTVLHRPDVSIEHWQDRPEVYAAFRARDYLPLVASRHGLRQITDLQGNLREFPAVGHAA
jgi:GT2 family glycosyltransferase